MNVVLVTKDNDSSRAASIVLSFEETQRSACFLEWALQSQLVTLPSVAFLLLLSGPAPWFDCQVLSFFICPLS